MSRYGAVAFLLGVAGVIAAGAASCQDGQRRESTRSPAPRPPPMPAHGDVGGSARAARPNVVVILADDLGYSELGCYGSEIATPHLDRLAAGGVRFTQFYNQARCCPSRAALLTGRYPHQVGVGAMIDGYAKWIRDAAASPAFTDRLSLDSPTVAELLREAGFRTLMCGKWHMGDRPAEWPKARGFDRSFALVPGAMNYW